MTNMRDVFEAGGRRIAVVRAIMAAEQPTLVTQYFLSQLNWFDRMREINPST
jgi:thiamine-phosphate pyrophosphorylase